MCVFYNLQYIRKIDRFRAKEKLRIFDYNIYDMRNRHSKREEERERDGEILTNIDYNVYDGMRDR